MPLPSLSDIPFSLAVPAAVTALAYLDAKHSIFYDARLISGALKGARTKNKAEKVDRVNAFYILEDHALSSKTAYKEFIVYNGHSWTYRDSYEMALRFGSWFKNVKNVQKGDIVALDCMNSENFLFMIMGLWSIAAVPALINFNLTANPLVHSLKVSTAKLAIVDNEVRDHFPPEIMETLGAASFRDGQGPLEVEFLTSEIEDQVLKMEPVREDDKVRSGVTERDPALLVYTSGTTGLPKPAVVGWVKCHLSTTYVATWMGLTQNDRLYTCMPLYHSSACILGFINALKCGSTLIIGRKFSAKRFMAEASENNATVIQYVGETLRYILAAPANIDPVTGENLDTKHNIRMAMGNGLRPDIWNPFKKRFNIPTIAEFYASTEGHLGAWNISSNDFAAGAVGRNGTIGRFLAGRQLAIVEVDWETQEPWRDPKTGLCKKVPRGDPGELLLRLDPNDPKANFQGYFKNTEASEKKIMRNVLEKGDAFFRTGDMMRWDDEGRWYFSDRLGDTFRWKSENVSTSEVAEVIGSHPAVHEANVYGVALPNHDGRAGCAALTLTQQVESGSTSGQALEPSRDLLDGLAAHALKSLARYATPLFLRVMPEMPATGNMKQQKTVLRDQGVDPAKIDNNDRLYWLQGNVYVPFGEKEWERLNSGKARL